MSGEFATWLGDRHLLGDLAREYETLKQSGQHIDYRVWINNRLRSKLSLQSPRIADGDTDGGRTAGNAADADAPEPDACHAAAVQQRLQQMQHAARCALQRDSTAYMPRRYGFCATSRDRMRVRIPVLN
jgi:hypothetical protein